ncbi:MAG: cation:proton antiporter [Candidatus Altiarchaeales archaeon ex4484_2]|nr:MAG: cation:proton antiporter [Candidatus Altiarchaeales archaeon ex4484_2]
MGEENNRMIFMMIAAGLGALILICLIRAVLGPTAPDRLVAMDTTNTLVVAVLVVLGAAWNEIIYVDVAIVYAMLSFVSTLYISKYLEAAQ